jgi:hypothetical protein
MSSESRTVLLLCCISIIMNSVLFMYEGINPAKGILLAVTIVLTIVVGIAYVFSFGILTLYLLPNFYIEIIFDFEDSFAFFNKAAIQRDGVIICLGLLTFIAWLVL